MFLKNHINDVVSIDFFIVPTIRFKLLFVLVVLAHSRRKVVHFNVTENPTAQWTAQQIAEALPWDSAPKYLLLDRDAIYGGAFQNRVHGMGIKQVVSAPRSPWQNPFVERSSVPYGATASIMSSPLTSITLGASSRDISITTTTGERISRYRWTRPNPRPVHSLDAGSVVEVAELDGYITITNCGPQ